MARQVAPLWSPSRAAVEKEAKRRPVFYTYMNPWPFVGILIVLLFLFMGIPVVHSFVPVDLPSAFHTTAQPKGAAEHAMKIYVTRGGGVFFRTDRVLPESLPILIRAAVQEGTERKAYLAVDSRTKFRDVATVVKQIGNADVHEICILACKREK